MHGSANRPRMSHDEQLRELMLRHAAALRRYAVARVGDAAADDVVAETFAAAWRGIGSFDPELGSELAWLVGLARNRAEHLRRTERRWRQRCERAARHAGNGVDVDGGSSDADARLDAQALRAVAVAALGRLPRREREVLLLVALAGLEPAEVAAVLGLSPVTVRSHLLRARRALGARLAPLVITGSPKEH